MAAAAAASAAMAAAAAGAQPPEGSDEVKDETVKEESNEKVEQAGRKEGDGKSRHKDKKVKTEASKEEQPHVYMGIGQWQVVDRDEDSLYYHEVLLLFTKRIASLIYGFYVRKKKPSGKKKNERKP